MTVLDIQTAKEISELLKEGKSLDEIRKLVDQHGGTINAWIADALLSKDLDAPLSQLEGCHHSESVKGHRRWRPDPSCIRAIRNEIIQNNNPI